MATRIEIVLQTDRAGAVDKVCADVGSTIAEIAAEYDFDFDMKVEDA